MVDVGIDAGRVQCDLTGFLQSRVVDVRLGIGRLLGIMGVPGAVRDTEFTDLVTGQTVEGDISEFLQSADSGSYLDQRGALFTTGPTGTNVMDIMLVLKSA